MFCILAREYARIQRRVAVSLEKGIVVDADGHIMEPANLWQDYIEPEFRERAIRVVRDESDGDKLMID